MCILKSKGKEEGVKFLTLMELRGTLEIPQINREVR